MKITSFDNTAVEEYINSLKQKETENIRSLQIENDRNDVLITVLKVSIIPIALSLAVLILMAGVGSTRSFEQVKRNFLTIEDNSIATGNLMMDTEPLSMHILEQEDSKTDEILDVSELIKNLKKNKVQEFEVLNNSENTITDYVIFEHQILNIGNVAKFTIGKKYSDVNQTQPKTAWCYLTLKNNSGIRETVHLVKKENGKRNDFEISQKVYAKMKISNSKLRNLKSKCVI